MSYAGSLFQATRSGNALKLHGFTVRFLVAIMLLLSPSAGAQQEVPGPRDFPLIKRYEGSRLIGYDSRAFDSFKLIIGKLTTRGGYAVYDAVREVEGRHTRFLYLAPQQRSSLEVFRNYEADLVAKGFSILFKCSGADECESSYGTEFYRVLYPPSRRLQNSELSKAAFNVPAEPHYLAATLARPEGDVSVSLYIAVERGGFQENNDRVAVLLNVFEAKPMEEKMVVVDATKMAKDIAATGKVALYGLYFDTDKADLKRESDPALAEIAKLLKAQPDLKVISWDTPTMWVVLNTTWACRSAARSLWSIGSSRAMASHRTA